MLGTRTEWNLGRENAEVSAIEFDESDKLNDTSTSTVLIYIQSLKEICGLCAVKSAASAFSCSSLEVVLKTISAGWSQKIFNKGQ